MNKTKPNTPPKVKSGILIAVRNLKANESLTLTTAKEAYLICGCAGAFKKDGFRIRRQLDGDNLIVWKEKIEP